MKTEKNHTQVSLNVKIFTWKERKRKCVTEKVKKTKGVFPNIGPELELKFL